MGLCPTPREGLVFYGALPHTPQGFETLDLNVGILVLPIGIVRGFASLLVFIWGMILKLICEKALAFSCRIMSLARKRELYYFHL